jgi:hypothetical protein
VVSNPNISINSIINQTQQKGSEDPFAAVQWLVEEGNADVYVTDKTGKPAFVAWRTDLRQYLSRCMGSHDSQL